MPSLPDWACAHGGPILSAAIRSRLEDFVVVENLPFPAAGDGEHDLLTIRKRGANTAWVARQLARHAGVPARDVGYSGLKDRHAVTTQYFSVRRPGRDGSDWTAFDAEGVEILEAQRHQRKLRRGAHDSNDFSLVLRSAAIDGARDALEARCRQIVGAGVPNYFGPQRFGHDAGNLALARALIDGRRAGRADRGMAISAARALLFNEVLDARVRAGSWNRLVDGDLANLDGTNSIFDVETPTAALQQRCTEFDLHPAGTLWGKGAPLAKAVAAGIEMAVAARHAALADGLVDLGVDAGSRALRLRPQRLRVRFDEGRMRLDFRLPGGAFATSLLRELVHAEDVSVPGRPAN